MQYNGFFTSKGEPCHDLSRSNMAQQNPWLRFEGGEEYHACAFGDCASPRIEWVNARNIRDAR